MTLMRTIIVAVVVGWRNECLTVKNGNQSLLNPAQPKPNTLQYHSISTISVLIFPGLVLIFEQCMRTTVSLLVASVLVAPVLVAVVLEVSE